MNVAKLRLNKTTLILAAGLLLALKVKADDGPPPKPDLNFEVGAGSMYMPAFIGSKTYQLMLVPDLRITYKDDFFASYEDGVGYNLYNSDGWRAGPLMRYEFGRNEDGANPLRVAGPKSNALRGLGNISDTLELGGFADYTWDKWNAKAELLQGVNGAKGFVSNLSLSYAADISHTFYREGPPLIVSMGPDATLVGGAYNRTYFGVDAKQSTNSGLPRYDAGGGVLKYGLESVLILPVTYKITATLIAGYHRLSGDAAKSPLIRERGTPNQAGIGIFFTYSIGFSRQNAKRENQ